MTEFEKKILHENKKQTSELAQIKLQIKLFLWGSCGFLGVIAGLLVVIATR